MSLDLVKRRLCCCLYKDRQSKYGDTVQYNADDNNTIVVSQPSTKASNGFHDISDSPRVNGTTNSGFEDDIHDFDEVNLDEYEMPERYKKQPEDVNTKKSETGDVIHVTGLMLDDLYEKNEDSLESEEYREPDVNVITSASDEDVKLSQTAGIHRLTIVEKGDNIQPNSRSSTTTESSGKARAESNEDTSYSDAITTQIETTNQTITTVGKTNERTESQSRATPDVVLQRAAYLSKLPDLEDTMPIIVTATEVRTTTAKSDQILKSPDDEKYVITDHEPIPNSSMNSPDDLKLDDIREEDRDSSDKDTSTNTDSNRTTDPSRPNISMYGELNEESSESLSTNRTDPPSDSKRS